MPEVKTEVECTDKTCVRELISIYAARYGVDEGLAMEVARCESQFKSDAVGDGGKAYGVYQFHRPTFDEFSKKFGDDLDYENTEHNIKLAIWALSSGKGYHWTCYQKIASK